MVGTEKLRFVRTRRLYCVVVLVMPALASAQAVVIGQRVKPVKPLRTPVTYDERNEESPLNKVCQVDSLALPFISALHIRGPKRVAAGEFLVEQYGQSKLQHQILWRAVPWNERHQEFIDQYSTLDERTEDGLQLQRAKMRLLAWCEKNKLVNCAEFVLRDYLYHKGANVETSLYKSSVKRWKAYATAHPSPYTFTLPLKGEWHALVDETRHHQKKHWAVFAYDIVVQMDGRLHVGLNVKENHFAWERPVFAVADGVIIEAKDKHKDHPIGRPGPGTFANLVRLDCGGGIYADYAHLRQGSLVVKKGDKVERGQLFARVGNSGASGVPHLHFSMTDRDGFSVAGRYHFEVLSTNGWQPLEGVNIEEGWNFRPIDE